MRAASRRRGGCPDATPAPGWPPPPQAAATRYVTLAGGADALLANARAAFAEGDYRWVAEVVGHLVFAEPEHAEARELQAQAFEQLAFGAENGTWRNFFLMGALELREGVSGTAAVTAPPDIVRNLSAEQLFDVLAIRIDGPRAGDRRIALHWRFTDTEEEHRLTLEHGVLNQRRGAPTTPVDATVNIERAALNEVLTGAATIEDIATSGRLRVDGDAAKLGELLGLLDPPDPSFAIVTP